MSIFIEVCKKKRKDGTLKKCYVQKVDNDFFTTSVNIQSVFSFDFEVATLFFLYGLLVFASGYGLGAIQAMLVKARY